MGKNFAFLGLIFALTALLYAGCEEADTVGFPAGEQKIQTIFLDTFTVKTSTVLLDSVATSETGRMLVGGYIDPVFGKTASSSFIELGVATAADWAPPATAVLDSMVLILKYDKYFYGDTTQVQNLVVHELSESPKYRPPSNSENLSFFFSGGLYNQSNINVYPTPIGSINYRPRPTGKGKLSIRLNTPKAQEWLDIAKGENKSQLSSDNFLNIFKGVKVSTPTPTNAAVIGFVADSTVMRIYYSQPNIEGVFIQSYFDFQGNYDPELQYNQIIADRTGTPLQNLAVGSPVSSELTNNETFIQAGTGILTKIEFPNFRYLTPSNEKFMILAANLVVIPINTQDRQKKLPASLGLLIMNKANIPTSTMAMDFDYTQAQTAYLSHQDGNKLITGEDLEFNRTSQYTFSIIQYTDSLVTNAQNILPSLMLYTPDGFTNSTNQLRIGNGINQTSKIKLEIYLSRLK